MEGDAGERLADGEGPRLGHLQRVADEQRLCLCRGEAVGRSEWERKEAQSACLAMMKESEEIKSVGVKESGGVGGEERRRRVFVSSS